MIRIAKVARIINRPTLPDGFEFVNTLSWFPNNVQTIRGMPISSYEVTPYYLKDENGVIFESAYQSERIFRSVDAQHQVQAGRVIWNTRPNYMLMLMTMFFLHIGRGEIRSAVIHIRSAIRMVIMDDIRHCVLFIEMKLPGNISECNI